MARVAADDLDVDRLTTSEPRLQWLTRRWSTFPAELEYAAEHHGSRLAIISGEVELSYAELAQRAESLALVFARAGAVRGDRVALLMADCCEWVVAFYAAARLGLVIVPVNTRFQQRELAHILSESAPSLLVTGQADGYAYLNVIAAAAGLDVTELSLSSLSRAYPSIIGAISFSEEAPTGFTLLGATPPTIADRAARDAGPPLPAARPEPADPVAILYTSGTTGLPKGAVIHHGALLRNTAYIDTKMNMSHYDRYLLSVPLFSTSGVGTLTQCLIAAATLVLLGKFEVERLISILERRQVTGMFVFDQIVSPLREAAGSGRQIWQGVRRGTGAPLTAANRKFLMCEMGMSDFVSVYGMSEGSTAIAMSWASDPEDWKLHFCGAPQPGVEVEIRDPDTHRRADVGAQGEICIRGYTVTSGYFRRPEETARSSYPGGWFRTGDLGYVTNNGQIVYTGRLKEVIKPNGYNVSTREIENAINEECGPKEIAVIGVPDSTMGEAPVAFVEWHEGREMSEAEIRSALRGKIASYKMPRHVVSISDWPRTATGKVQKVQLRSIWNQLNEDAAS
jgi:fatty-acyl-CoA synthase